MKTKLWASAIAFGLFATTPSFAANEAVVGKVTHLQNWGAPNLGNPNSKGSEGLWVRLDNAVTANPYNCTADWYILETNSSDISRAMLLSAKISGQQVSLTIHGGTCSSDGRPFIVSVNLVP